MKAVCIDCRKEMICKSTGMMVSQSDINDSWYRLQLGDLYECTKCGKQVVMEFGNTFDRKSDELELYKILWVD